MPYKVDMPTTRTEAPLPGITLNTRWWSCRAWPGNDRTGPFSSREGAWSACQERETEARDRTSEEIENAEICMVQQETVATFQDGREWRVYEIAEGRIGTATAKLEKLAKKATKLDLAAPKWEVVGHVDYVEKKKNEYGDDVTKVQHKILVALLPSPVRIEGYRFLATVQHVASDDGTPMNLIKVSPEVEDAVLAQKWRKAAPWCDHCRTIRRRLDTFLVEKLDNRSILQIGRNCLADFLGGSTGAQALEMANLERDCMGALEDEEGFGGSSDRGYLCLSSYLTWVAASIRVDGWLSRTAARDREMASSTADCAMTLEVGKGETASKERARVKKALYEKHGDEGWKTCEDETAAALEWTRTSIPEDTTSDYLWNLRVACASSVVPDRAYGIAASCIAAYRREKEREIERGKQMDSIANEWFGKVGDKIGRKLSSADRAKGASALPEIVGIVSRIMSTEGNYGARTMIKVQADSGHLLVWWASGTAPSVNVGDRVSLSGTISKCNEYKGVKETQITRGVLTRATEPEAK